MDNFIPQNVDMNRVTKKLTKKEKKKKLLGMLTKEDIESCGHSLMWTWTHTHVDRLVWTMTHVDKRRKTWTWIHINKIRKRRRHRLMLPKPLTKHSPQVVD